MKKLSLLFNLTIVSIIISSCTEKKEYCDCIYENSMIDMTDPSCEWINALSSEEEDAESDR